MPTESMPLEPIAKSSLSQLVVDRIQSFIVDTGLKPGDRLPSERQLAERLSVSRPTIRDALRILEEEGRVVRRVGSGTFVSSVPVVEAGLETLVSFTEMMARTGHEAGTGYLDVSEGGVSTEEAELFQVEVGTPKVVVERVRTLDGRTKAGGRLVHADLGRAVPADLDCVFAASVTGGQQTVVRVPLTAFPSLLTGVFPVTGIDFPGGDVSGIASGFGSVYAGVVSAVGRFLPDLLTTVGSQSSKSSPVAINTSAFMTIFTKDGLGLIW